MCLVFSDRNNYITKNYKIQVLNLNGNEKISVWLVVNGMDAIVFVLKLKVYSFSSLKPNMDTVAIPFLALAEILTGNFLVFLNLKSIAPYTTVASLPAGRYEVTN